MPINFSQPDPLGLDITARAAAAESAAKAFPGIAQIYESAARLRASGGGGGGGHGGTVYSGGPIQQLSNGDGGALSMVEQQANREQQSSMLRTEIGADLVGKHIKMQEDYQRERHAQSAAEDERMMQLLNPQLYGKGQGSGAPPVEGPTPRPIQFTPEDSTSLNRAGQALSDLKTRFGNMEFAPETYQMMRAPLQDEYDQLTAKQQAAKEAEQQRAYKQAISDQAHERGLLNIDMQHAGQNGYRQIPELPTPIRARDRQTGKIYTVNADEIKHVAEAQRQARDFNGKLQLEREKQSVKDPVIEQKLEQSAVDHYIKIRTHEIDRLNKEEDVFMKEAKPGDARTRATPEGFDNTVAERMKAHGFKPTLGEFLDDWKARRGKPGQAGAAPAVTPKEEASLQKEAVPEYVASYQEHIGTMPRMENGTPDLNKANPEQLDQLRLFYTNPKELGVKPEVAAQWIRAIDATKEARGVPVQRDHAPVASSRFGKGAANIAAGTVDVGNRLAGGAQVIGRDLAGTAEEAARRAEALGGLVGVTPERVNRQVDNFKRGVGVIGDKARSAGQGLHGVADRIERGGANTYDVFKRWLGR